MMVEDSLIAYRKTGGQRMSQHARVRAERHVLRLAETRYSGGVADYLEVLDAQRSLFTAEFDEVQAISCQLLSLIRLYKALGGGWPPRRKEPVARLLATSRQERIWSRPPTVACNP